MTVYDHAGDPVDLRDLDAAEPSRHRAIRRGAGYGIRPDEHGYVKGQDGSWAYYVEYDGGGQGE